jgi:Serine acetyltransferase
MSRDLEIHQHDTNALFHWNEYVSCFRTALNILLIEVSKFLPLSLKNRVLALTGMELGRRCAIALGVQIDVFFPELIEICEGATVGYGATILTHETTADEFRKGEVKIGKDALVGANATVLPGVEIGDGAKVAAGSVVTGDVEDGEFVGGIPAQEID